MIQTDALSFSYPVEEGQRRTTALDNVTLSIEKGSFVVVLGHNGSGKSTLAKHMNAVLLPSGGAVYVEGMDTKKEELLLEIRRRVGMVFQNPDNQIVANVVEEDVAFGPENLGVPTAEIRHRVDDALAAVGMEQFASHAPHLLSGGQKQRIAIARVFLKNPPILVLDEATSALDSVTEAAIQASLEKLSRGRTTIVVAHRLATVRGADHIAVIDKEGVNEYGTHQELIRQNGVYKRFTEIRERAEGWNLSQKS